jgi:hypothetical protein
MAKTSIVRIQLWSAAHNVRADNPVASYSTAHKF